MTTQLYCTEGVILHAAPFQDYHQILSVFSKEFGLIKLIYKYSLAKNKQSKGCLAPLTSWEFTFKKGKGDLYKGENAEYVDGFLSLRNNMDTLDAACIIAKSILKSQLPEVAVPNLYALLFTYLKKLPLAQSPFTLSSSFILKTLFHEGLLHLKDECACCGTHLKQVCLYRGETYCETHLPDKEGLIFPEEEAALLFILTYQRSFQSLCEWTAPAEFHQKVSHLFEHGVSH